MTGFSKVLRWGNQQFQSNSSSEENFVADECARLREAEKMLPVRMRIIEAKTRERIARETSELIGMLQTIVSAPARATFYRGSSLKEQFIQ